MQRIEETALYLFLELALVNKRDFKNILNYSILFVAQFNAEPMMELPLALVLCVVAPYLTLDHVKVCDMLDSLESHENCKHQVIKHQVIKHPGNQDDIVQSFFHFVNFLFYQH